MRFSIVFLLCVALLPSLVQAETAYVTDRLFVSIREGQGNEFPVVKSIATGTKLEVLQRLGGFVLVRESSGAEGWIADRYLIDSVPGKADLDTARNKLKLATSEVVSLKQKLAESGNRTREEKARATSLALQLKNMGAAVGENAGPGDKNEAAGASGPAETPIQTGDMQSGLFFSWLWFLIAFAMLVTGFITGVVWLRELNRKKMGGMYLRI